MLEFGKQKSKFVFASVGPKTRETNNPLVQIDTSITFLHATNATGSVASDLAMRSPFYKVLRQ